MKLRIILPIVLTIMTIFILSCFYMVDPGETALHLRAGTFIAQISEPGCYFQFPFIDSIITINNRIQKVTIETQAMSKDLQRVSVGIAINYRICDPLLLYRKVGLSYEETIINPLAQEAIKAVMAKYSAEDLIVFRHEVKDKIYIDLNTKLTNSYIALSDLNFIHSDFSKDFNEIVEEKQIAEQTAKRAKNITESIREEALQSRLKSDAEAYAIKVMADAEAYSIKAKRESVTKDIVMLKAIEKWNGTVPRVITGQNGILNFKDIL